MTIPSTHFADGTSSAMLDVKNLAAILACSTRTVYRLADGGKMPPPVKLGSLVRWNRAVIEKWIGAGCPSCRETQKGAAR
jgi:excisionase family DNA binding protein